MDMEVKATIKIRLDSEGYAKAKGLDVLGDDLAAEVDRKVSNEAKALDLECEIAHLAGFEAEMPFTVELSKGSIVQYERCDMRIKSALAPLKQWLTFL